MNCWLILFEFYYKKKIFLNYKESNVCWNTGFNGFLSFKTIQKNSKLNSQRLPIHIRNFIVFLLSFHDQKLFLNTQEHICSQTVHVIAN